MTCNRKKMTESQAAVVAQRMGNKDGIRRYPAYCKTCNAYHTTTIK